MKIQTPFNRFARLLPAIAFAIAASGLAMTMTACNTTEGVGEDIEAVGESIDDAASDND